MREIWIPFKNKQEEKKKFFIKFQTLRSKRAMFFRQTITIKHFLFSFFLFGATIEIQLVCKKNSQKLEVFSMSILRLQAAILGNSHSIIISFKFFTASFIASWSFFLASKQSSHVLMTGKKGGARTHTHTHTHITVTKSNHAKNLHL